MVRKEEILLAEFESGLDQLIQYCNSLQSENTKLKREMVDKEKTIKELIIGNEQLKKRYDNLKFAKSFTSSSEDSGNEMTQQARERLSKLVQDVDKCITMLKI